MGKTTSGRSHLPLILYHESFPGYHPPDRVTDILVLNISWLKSADPAGKLQEARLQRDRQDGPETEFALEDNVDQYDHQADDQIAPPYGQPGCIRQADRQCISSTRSGRSGFDPEEDGQRTHHQSQDADRKPLQIFSSHLFSPDIPARYTALLLPVVLSSPAVLLTSKLYPLFLCSLLAACLQNDQQHDAEIDYRDTERGKAHHRGARRQPDQHEDRRTEQDRERTSDDEIARRRRLEVRIDLSDQQNAGADRTGHHAVHGDQTLIVVPDVDLTADVAKVEPCDDRS